jgi:DNA uptake protein ComE-like DNA-binding protein
MLLAAAAVAALGFGPGALSAQLGKQVALVEPNVAPDTTMAKVPGVTPAIITAIKAAKPILSVTDLDKLLAANSLTAAQRTTLYGKMFVHVDVNRGTDAEFMLIPGMNTAKLTAIKAGRPWKTFADFEAAMTKASNATEAARIEEYLFIPIDLNTWTDPIMDSFSSIGVGTRQWKREFAEYRPWKTMDQFNQEIGKYLRANPNELKRLARYVIINP